MSFIYIIPTTISTKFNIINIISREKFFIN